MRWLTVASALNPGVLNESNEKRIKRLSREVNLGRSAFAKLMLALLPVKTGLLIMLDRTTWKQIETLFSALKLRGFDLKATHMLHQERFNKLLVLTSF